MRPHARFNGVNHRKDEPRAPQCIAPANDNADNTPRAMNDPKARAAIARSRAARQRDRFFAYRHVQQSLNPVYCVELAAAFGWRVMYARTLLLGLEREGWLSSTRTPAPRTGNGRRYFRVREDHPLAFQNQGTAP